MCPCQTDVDLQPVTETLESNATWLLCFHQALTLCYYWLWATQRCTKVDAQKLPEHSKIIITGRRIQPL